jgi:hypothetical protein
VIAVRICRDLTTHLRLPRTYPAAALDALNAHFIVCLNLIRFGERRMCAIDSRKQNP